MLNPFQMSTLRGSIMSKRLEKIESLEKEISRHKAYGDTVAIDICCREIEEFEAMSDEEYDSLIKIKKMYAANSVKPIVTK